MSEAEKQRPDSFINKDDGRQFWQSRDADEDSMIGISSVLPSLSKVDLEGSRSFLAKLGIGSDHGLHAIGYALEGGAGIGRFTRSVLLNVAEQVDVIEPIDKFTENLKGVDGIRNIFNFGLEEWHPAQGVKYDLIWNQGCICHLTDAQVVQYLNKCKATLKSKDSLIIIKENLSIRGVDVFDSVDSTVTRENRKFLSLFQQAGLRLVEAENQSGLPGTFLPVKMYALAQSED
ncbi:hypothetical protein G7Y89_g4744 [Cudoniella acicularis]|uniref:Alpha N-terminal protein methyltransferase 1 n=1 Tax=Cudoniella acicularis TaxID=354080 RepID=A0A8H4RR03_9HELO|nr:hypothetical protein G7Y89_g4744 [Cudoniella acicularis]